MDSAVHIEDAYKWLFQATLGGEHAVSSPDEARAWMDEEWRTLGPPRHGEPMTVRLRPDGKLLRVNLRPYKAAGGSKEALLRVFVRSAHEFHSTKKAFVREWKALGVELTPHPIGNLTEAAWKRLDTETTSGYPAIEHSDAYLKNQKPAYRVVEARYWRGLERILTAKRSLNAKGL